MWPVDGEYICAEWYWMPARAVRERVKRDRVPYDVWARQGWIELIDGPVIDERLVRRRIEQLSGIFDIREIAYDKARAPVITKDLADYGLTMLEFGQTAGWYDEPTRQLRDLILQRRMGHEVNPVSKYCASCLAVKTDEDGKIKPIKPVREENSSRIDGIVARIMALDRALRSDTTASIYEHEETAVM